jgi:tetratricopeptide (TPR) repeat protein
MRRVTGQMLGQISDRIRTGWFGTMAPPVLRSTFEGVAPSIGPLADFAAGLRRLRQQSGQPSVRDLVVLFRAVGQPYPRSTISDKLSGNSKPTWEFVAAFVSACARFRGDSGPEHSARRVGDLASWRSRYHALQRDLATDRDHRGGGQSLGTEKPAKVAHPQPRQLPPAVARFTGRQAELAALDDALTGRDPDALGIVLLAGTAGVGKTALAVQWAHRVAARFPDGQLYVDLRGYDPQLPLPPDQALSAFLRALGLTGEEIPYELDERATRLRSLLSGRRMLVVLDNARTVDQIRPLLPGDAGCFVVVTSRDRMTGLVSRHGAARVDVGQLPVGDAVGLLHRLIGARVTDDQAAAAALAERCVRLPLTLRIAAEYASTHRATSLDRLVDALASERSLPGVFGNDDDEHADVQAVFSWSYRDLPPAAARAFRLLAAHPGSAVAEPALQALIGTEADAGPMAAILVAGHLIQSAGPDRWGMHDLLRAYAGDLLAGDDSERRAAQGRLLDYYLAAVVTAMDIAFPADAASRPTIAMPALPAIQPPTEETARAWLDNERANLTACVDLAARQGWADHAVLLGGLLWRYLDNGGHHADALAIHQSAQAAAHERGDLAEEGKSRNRLGTVYFRWGRHRDALHELQQAVQINRRAGDRGAEGGAHNTIGLVYVDLADYPQSVHHLEAALGAALDAAKPIGVAFSLDNLGRTHRLWGRVSKAIDCHQRALEVCRGTGFHAAAGKMLANLAAACLLQGRYAVAREHATAALDAAISGGDLIGECAALEVLGQVCGRLEQPEEALRHIGRAIAIQQDMGHPDGLPDTLNALAEVYASLGRHAQAADSFTVSLRHARVDGRNRLAQSGALNGLGQTALRDGDPRGAIVHHTEALAISREIDQWYESARATDGIAAARHRGHETSLARAAWTEALAWYERVGAPEAVHVRQRLAETDPAAGRVDVSPI